MSPVARARARAVFPACLLVAAACSAKSTATFDDLRRQAEDRQASYPPPTPAPDPAGWPSLLPPAGPALNGAAPAGTTMIEAGPPGQDAGPDVYSLPDSGGAGVASALTGHATFSPSSTGPVTAGTTSFAASVSGGPDLLVIRPGSPTTISVGYDSNNSNIDAFGVQFGDGSSIARVPYPNAAGNQSGTANIVLNVASSACNTLSVGCYAITTNVYALLSTAPEFMSQPLALDTALICGNCQAPNCGTLDPTCVGVQVPDAGDASSASDGGGGTVTVATCGNTFLLGSGSKSVTTTINMNDVVNGSASFQFHVVSGSAQFILSDDSGPLLGTNGCVTGTSPLTPFDYSSSSAQVTVTVNPCNDASWQYGVTCPL